VKVELLMLFGSGVYTFESCFTSMFSDIRSIDEDPALK